MGLLAVAGTGQGRRAGRCGGGNPCAGAVHRLAVQVMRIVLLSVAIIAALLGAGTVLVRFFPEVANPWLIGTPLDTLVGKTKPLYKWRNKQGQWQATDKPPPAGTPFEVKQYPIDYNIVPSREPGTP